MTSRTSRLLMIGGLIALSGLAQGQSTPRDPLAPPPSASPRSQATVVVPVQPQLPPRIAPASLRERISTLARSFDGRAGISVVSLNEGWQADYNAAALFPQQSCSKLWVAITAMDAVDKGRISLNDRVTLGRDDLTLFHQPISSKIIGAGGHTTTLGELLFTAITESDNTANDKLMRAVGGPQA